MSGSTHGVLSLFISALFLPPLLFIWLALAGLWLKRMSLVLLALFLLYALATPQCAYWLTRPLEPVSPLPAALQDVDAIVVLGGGKNLAIEYGDEELSSESLLRLRYAAWLARQLHKPLLLSGGAPYGGEPEARVMARTLTRDYGLQARWLEGSSNTTGQNAQNSARLLKPTGMTRIALVSSAWHLRRASALFRQQGFEVLPAPTGFVRLASPSLTHYLPSGRAMQQSWQAWREWYGLGWARLRALTGGA